MLNENKLSEQLKELGSETLLEVFQEANRCDGSFDFCDVCDLEDLASWTDSYELAKTIVYGDVRNITEPVRYNGYGNLESVSEYDLYDDCKYYLEDLAAWLVNHDGDIDLSYYDIDTDACEEEEA